MAKKTKGYSAEEIRAAQQAGGRMRLGPREKVKKKEATETGYKAKRSTARNATRNQAIQRRLMACKPEKRRALIEQLADKYGISTKTVEHIFRYWKMPEG